MEKMRAPYCVKCGNTGIDIDGNPCTCRFNAQSFYDTVSCLNVPEQYRGIIFSKFLVPKDMPEAYADYMENLYNDIVSLKLKQHNICLCSPIGHSKTILAYSCMETLFRNGVELFPVFDVLELKRIMLDTDMCRKSFYEVQSPELLINGVYLFAKVPRMATWEVYDTMAVLLDRRVRRGNSTIFLYDGTWEQLIRNDKQGILTGLLGDGNYNTIEARTWRANAIDAKPPVQLEDNIG